MDTPCQCEPPPGGAEMTTSLSFSTLTAYGRMAERHWREFLPKMVAELEAKGQLHTLLLEAEEQTAREIDQLRRQLMQHGKTAQQAQDQAWEMVREKYIFLPSES